MRHLFNKKRSQIYGFVSISFIFIAVAIFIIALLNINPQTVLATHDVTATYDLLHFWFLDDDGSTINNASGWGIGDTAQDTGINDITLGSDFRLRIGINESASSPTLNLALTPKLQFKASATACDDASGWTDVPTETSCGSNAVCQSTSAVFTDGDSTTQIFTDKTFLSGGDGINTNGSPNQATYSALDQQAEWEWMLQMTSNASQGIPYTIRATYSDGTVLDAYTTCPQATVPAANSPPVVSNVVLNGSSAITLTENTTTAVSATADVSDVNGADDIISATSTIYRSGVTAGCSADDNNCYKISSCTFSGATSTVTCTANVQFFADPTDASSTDYSAQNWQAEITITDASSATGASSTLSGVELDTLWAINVTSAINYGSVNPNSDTSGTNQSATVTNTGNAAIDVEVSGTDMTGGGTIAVTNQKYATSTFTYSSCTICTALSSTPAAYEIDLLKPTSASAITDLIYWGLAVPNGTAQGAHSGTNTFTAISD